MAKVDQDFVIHSYEGAVENYRRATVQLGLWASEEYVLTKYFRKEDRILDLGCGTGRTTFGLFERGYHRIEGIDVTPDMIREALRIGCEKQYDVSFAVADARALPHASASFDRALFSFNGLMQIPKRENRGQALQEIHRVLKPGGIFVFTTHDREHNPKWAAFWQKEKTQWECQTQDPRLHDYGDRIISARNEVHDTFVHFPTRAELQTILRATGWEILEDFYRSDLFTEKEAVKHFSAECRFWVVQKQMNTLLPSRTH